MCLGCVEKRDPHVAPKLKLEQVELDDQVQDLEVLCAERVSQMTKTYNDIEAVTRLLEEKERDLELAARIGQTLLEKNKQLTQKNEQLEDQLNEANDQVSQLKHEVVTKDALLQLYVHEEDGSESPATPNKPLSLALHGLSTLEKRCRWLDGENESLREEITQLSTDTSTLEEKEASLVKDAVKQLHETGFRVAELEEELGAKFEVTQRQQEDITRLMSELISSEAKIKKMVVETTELNQHLKASQESQRSLTTEIGELTDKYHEALGLLQEAQEEVKALRRKHKPGVVRQHFSTFTPFLPEGSLAQELEEEIKKDMVYPEGYSPGERKSHNRRVMETARVAKRTSHRKSIQTSLSLNDSESMTTGSNRSSLYLSDADSFDTSFDPDGYSSPLGKPGTPGSADLEAALRRLSMRKANEMNEQYIHEQEEKHKRYSGDGDSTPTGYRTPDSIMSTGSGSNFSDLSRLSGFSGLSFRIPEKLQIVKPMEGSITLHQWQRLATPHLSGFLDPRPGIQIKGERPIDTEEEIYDLSDYEEDGPGMFPDPINVVPEGVRGQGPPECVWRGPRPEVLGGDSSKENSELEVDNEDLIIADSHAEVRRRKKKEQSSRPGSRRMSYAAEMCLIS